MLFGVVCLGQIERLSMSDQILKSLLVTFPSEVRACKAVADAGNARNHKEGIADILLNVADIGINIVQTLTNSKFIDEIVDNIFRT